MAEPTAESSASSDSAESKAGRNLPVAIAVGVVLGGVALASLIWLKWIFVVLAVVALWIGASEVIAAMATRGIRVLA